MKNEDVLDLSHLTPPAQAAALLPSAERIARIRVDRWIGYTRAGIVNLTNVV